MSPDMDIKKCSTWRACGKVWRKYSSSYAF